MKIFERYNFDVTGNILSLDDFVLARDKESDSLNGEKLDAVLKDAETDLETPIPPLYLSNYRAYSLVGSTGAYGNPYCQRMAMAFRLAIAEMYYKNGKYFDKMLDTVWAMLDEPTWVLPEHTVHMPDVETQRTSVPAAVGEKYAHGIELGSAYRSALIALIYHFFKDKFDEISPFINERIVYTVKTRAIDPFCNHYFWWEGMSGNRVNNWCPWIVSNTLLATALVEPDMAVREDVVRRSMLFLDNFINCYGEDGGCDEGPVYWNAAAGAMFDSLEMLEDISGGKINVYSEPLIKAMGEYEPRMNISGNYFVNFADSRCNFLIDGDMLRRFGKKCGSKILESFGEVMLTMIPINFDFKLPSRTIRSAYAKSIDVSAVKQVAATDTYFPDLKVMVLRDSETPDEGVFFAMKGGNNAEMHNHNDVGSFVVYNRGEPVLIDAGVGEYTKQTFSKDRYKIWSMQSLYHNLPSFDGVGEVAGAQYASCDEIYDKDARSLTLQLKDAYDSECALSSFTRRGSLCDGTVTVHDTVELGTEKTVDFVFLTHREPKATAPGEILLHTGMRLLYDDSLSLEIETFDPKGMNTVNMWGTEVLYRIHLTTRASACSYEFKITAN